MRGEKFYNTFIFLRRMLLVDFIIFYNSSLCIVCSFLSSFFPKKEEMKRCILRMLKERRNETMHSSNAVRSPTENSLKKHERILGTIASAKAGRRFRSFRKKSADRVSEKASRRDTRGCSHKTSSVTRTLRIFGVFRCSWSIFCNMG